MGDLAIPLVYEKDGPLATFTLNRPNARNALTPELVCRLADAVRDFVEDPNLRVAILTGTGDKAFCSGGDLGTMLPLMSGDRPAADEWDRRVLEEPFVMAASSLRDFPIDKPIVAAINGACLAGGMEMVLGTDIRIAAEHAIFGLPEVRRAVIPFAGSLVRLPRQVPHCVAMELLLTGEHISAAQAHRIGLVNHVVPAQEVLPKARALAQLIAANGPVAVQAVKHAVQAASGRPLDEGFRIEDEAKRLVMSSEDAREGPRAFMEKREPRYLGR
ncbi:enoyl-CoA hydratase/isomerase family protein [Ramlibacter sp. AW1]|uniref:Enoyl-CoA hydratase/isomerase family protein n=1 Tax=Ramlibacter aurantiacus TaxID=2801330 RepID=A0A936ZBX5_9BURK|nr:enoyl-CoA hydratase-related protein [Ramlibacter aurantiacus]MBL0418719.1 enoyl-CoA hydratase/isomerase family protein [Ramlibacter aurantiacus]